MCHQRALLPLCIYSISTGSGLAVEAAENDSSEKVPIPRNYIPKPQKVLGSIGCVYVCICMHVYTVQQLHVYIYIYMYNVLNPMINHPPNHQHGWYFSQSPVMVVVYGISFFIQYCNMYINIHCICIYVYIYIYIYICIYIHIYIYIYMEGS